ncbi:MAG: hypothetical protein CL425_01630 [Acidimicrobiaceae bacterium]|nr:hypothetical protein [Acidimicrobiaceae bacterium]
MNTFKELYFPSSESRDLNKRLREEHELFLSENPEWVPNELRLLPKVIARAFNKMCPKTPLMVPLGWIDGTTWADLNEQERVLSLPEDEKIKGLQAHKNAIRGRCFRIPRPYEVKSDEAAFKAVQEYADVDRRVFNGETFDHDIPDALLEAFNACWERIAEPGEWWSGKERIAILEEVRKDRDEDHPKVRSSLADLSNTPSPIISPLTREIVRMVTSNAAEIDDKWAKEAISLIGEGKYSELVSLVVNIVPIDIFCLLVGRPVVSLPVPKGGKPGGTIPDGLSDGGAFVPWLTENFVGPNVARALSFVPKDNEIRMKLVENMYAGGGKFISMVWDENEPLDRAQVEIIAARTSSINECFY